tara:strand:+ start:881 stop:1291 length:411 start_codon:yes stop_codon:yes gene_type:complete
MKKLRKLSVNIVRNEFWNKKTKKSKIIHYYWFNGFINPSNRNKDIHKYTFIPNGDLKEMKMINGKLQTIKIHKDWLSTSNAGPYKRDDNNDVFYFLEGKMFYKNLKNTVYTGGMQICRHPLNKLSDSCIGGSNWIY